RSIGAPFSCISHVDTSPALTRVENTKYRLEMERPATIFAGSQPRERQDGATLDRHPARYGRSLLGTAQQPGSGSECVTASGCVPRRRLAGGPCPPPVGTAAITAVPGQARDRGQAGSGPNRRRAGLPEERQQCLYRHT